MTKKSLFKSISIYALGDLIVMGVSGLLLLPFYTRILSQETFGVFNILNASIVIFTFLVQFGIISAFSRMYFNYKTEYEKEIYIGNILLLHILLAFCLILFTVFFKNYLMHNFLPTIDNDIYYFYIPSIAILGFMTALYSVYLRIVERPTQFIIFQLATVGLYIVFIFIFFHYFLNKLDAILLALFISNSIMWLVAVYNLKYKINIDSFYHQAKQTLTFAFPIFISYIFYFLLNKFNIIYLQGSESLENIAIFSFALQLSTILTMFSVAIGKAVQPIIFKADINNVMEITNKMSKYYKLLLFIVFAFLLIFSDFIISLLAPENYSGSKLFFNILLISTFINAYRMIDSFLYMYHNKPTWLLFLTLIGGMTTLGLTLIFVPKYGSLASAYAILAGNIAMYLVNIYLYKKIETMEH